MNYTTLVTAEEDEAVRQALMAPLRAYNEGQVGPSSYRPLIVQLRDDAGAVAGGVWGHTALGWLFVQFLVVPQAARGSGLGSRLMQLAEQEAIARGCRGAWLDTFSFQAKGFYEKLGYRPFGELPDYPPPHARHFLYKHLPPQDATSPSR